MSVLGIIHAYPSASIVEDLSNYNKLHIFVPENKADSYKELFEKYDYVNVHGVLFEETKETVSSIVEISKKENIELFLPLYEGGLLLSSIVSNELNISFYSSSTVLASRNKYYLKLLMNSNFIKTPKTIPVFEYTPYYYLERELGLPFILKIVDSMNSQATLLVKSEEDYISGLSKTLEYLSLNLESQEMDRNRFCYGKDEVKLIAQEFCDGKEVNVDVLICGNDIRLLGIFEKAESKGPYFPETMSFYPPSISPEENEKIIEVAKAAAKAFQLNKGVAHIEVRMKNGKPRVLDIGLRPGGAYTIKAVNNLYNINYIQELANILLKNEFTCDFKLEDKSILYGGVAFSKSGILESIDGLECLRETIEVEDYNVLVKVNDNVVAPPFSAQPHLCYYYIKGNNLGKVKKINEKIQETIKFSIRGN